MITQVLMRNISCLFLNEYIFFLPPPLDQRPASRFPHATAPGLFGAIEGIEHTLSFPFFFAWYIELINPVNEGFHIFLRLVLCKTECSSVRTT